MRFISHRQPANPLWVKYIFVKGSIGSQSFNPKPFRYTLQFFTPCKALPGLFLCIFSSLTSLTKPVFSKRDLLWRYQQPVLGSSDQRKVPASLSLFLKSEKIPALHYLGKGPEYGPFSDFRPAPLAYSPGAQISNHGRYSGPSPIIHSSIWDPLEVGPHNYTWSGNHCWVNIPPSIPIFPKFENHRTLWFVFLNSFWVPFSWKLLESKSLWFQGCYMISS
jgi:hypothetical protein